MEFLSYAFAVLAIIIAAYLLWTDPLTGATKYRAPRLKGERGRSGVSYYGDSFEGGSSSSDSSSSDGGSD